MTPCSVHLMVLQGLLSCACQVLCKGSPQAIFPCFGLFRLFPGHNIGSMYLQYDLSLLLFQCRVSVQGSWRPNPCHQPAWPDVHMMNTFNGQAGEAAVLLDYIAL